MLVIPLLLSWHGTRAEEKIYTLTIEQWNVPRNENTILQMPALQELMQAYQAHAAARLVIKYPGGDEGTLWATELRAWLVSLGIASVNIELVPGARNADQIELYLEDNK